MKTVTINNVMFWFGRSTFTSDHGAIFAKFPNGSITEYNTYREWDSIKMLPDFLQAYKALSCLPD